MHRTITFVSMFGVCVSRFLLSLPFSTDALPVTSFTTVQVAPSNQLIITGLHALLPAGDVITFGVQPPVMTSGAGLQVNISCPTVNCGTLSPSSLTWIHADQVQYVSFTAPATGGNVQLAISIGGADAPLYLPMPNINLQVVASMTMSVLPTSMLPSAVSGAITVAPSTSFGSTIQLTISVSAGSVSPSPLVWSAGDTTPQSFTIQAPSIAQAVNLSFSLDPTSRTEFLTPYSVIINVGSPASSSSGGSSAVAVGSSSTGSAGGLPDLVFSLPSSLVVGQATTVTVTPSVPTVNGLYLAVQCSDSTVATSPIQFPAGSSAPLSFTITPDSTAGVASEVSCVFVAYGADAAMFAQPQPQVTLPVIGGSSGGGSSSSTSGARAVFHREPLSAADARWFD